VVVPLQPPGREGRFREAPHETYESFANDLIGALRPHIQARRYAVSAHCGVVPYALETIRRIPGAGLPPPVRLIASSWGAPQRGLYGRLGHLDLGEIDAVTEVKAVAASLGSEVVDELAELLAEVLEHDLVVQRGYRYPAAQRLPCPVTVLGWSQDDVVPDHEVHDGWDEIATVRHFTLDGAHRDFLSCPDALRDLLTRELDG
jgi:surfactin synthase thioesterase subunit